MLKIKFNLRNVVVIAICLTVSVTMFAQDVITLKDGTDIQASVLEISEVNVKFKKPTISMSVNTNLYGVCLP